MTTEAAPCRLQIPMQSLLVSPPPMTTTCLPRAVAPGGEPNGSGGDDHTTNQRMEIYAVLDALRRHADRADEHGAPLPIEIVSDSTYVVNCFRDKWWVKWQRNGWKNSKKEPVANNDLWEPLIELVQAGDVSFRWVKGHSGDPMNDLVDELAVAAVPTG